MCLHDDAPCLFEKTGVGLLVSSEIRTVQVQSGDRALSLKGKALDRREVGGVLVSGVGVSSNTGTLGSTTWLSSLPDLGRGGDILLVHGTGNSRSDGSSEDGKSGGRQECLSGLLGFSVQSNRRLLNVGNRRESGCCSKGGKNGKNGELHDTKL